MLIWMGEVARMIKLMTISKLTRNGLDKLRCSAGLGCLALAAALSAHGAPLTPGEPIVLEKTTGKFDFIRIDAAKRRLLLAHRGNKSFEVFDLDSRRVLKSLATGAAQDSAVDAQNGRYFVSVSAPPKMVIVDSAKLEITGDVPLPAAADLMTFNPRNGLAYVCNDTAGGVLVVDPGGEEKISTHILAGAVGEGLGRAGRNIKIVPDR